MSSYAYAILICARENDCVSELNSILRVCDISEFERAGEVGIGEMGIYAMDDNQLNVWMVENAINSIQWYDPWRVQLFIRGEDDDKYGEVKLSPKKINLSQVFETDGTHNKNGALIGEYKTVNDKTKSAVGVAKDVFGVASALTVGAIVSGLVSVDCLGEFIQRLSTDDRDTLLALADGVNGNSAQGISKLIERDGELRDKMSQL
jgi:hypothetical protein